jgi:hypothetical protein
MRTIQPSFGTIHFPAKIKKNLAVHRFFDWCRGQEENRLAWLAVIIFGHGCIITPFTLGFVMLSGNNFEFWPWAIAAMGMSLVTNLAALPTKITIPIFFLSVLIDLVVIVSCIVLVLNIR